MHCVHNAHAQFKLSLLPSMIGTSRSYNNACVCEAIAIAIYNHIPDIDTYITGSCL